MRNNKPPKKTMIGTSASDIAAQARAKAAELERRAKAMGWKTVAEYKNSGWAQNKSAFTKKPAPVKSTEVKVTTPKKLTTEQMSGIPFKNSTINKFQGTMGKSYVVGNKSDLYGTQAQQDSTYAANFLLNDITRTSKSGIGNMSGTSTKQSYAKSGRKDLTPKQIAALPDYKAPGNTGAGAFQKRSDVKNSDAYGKCNPGYVLRNGVCVKI
jgi:hypothetical protein